MNLRPLALLLALSLPVFADDKAPPENADAPAGEKKPDVKKEDKPKDDKAKDDKPKEHAGKVTLGGAEVKYLAQTGTVPVLKDDGATKADVFYVYYAVTDADGKQIGRAHV